MDSDENEGSVVLTINELYAQLSTTLSQMGNGDAEVLRVIENELLNSSVNEKIHPGKVLAKLTELAAARARQKSEVPGGNTSKS